MSDREAGEGQAAPRSLKSRLVPLGIIAGLMVAEGVGVFFLAKTISPDPIQVQGAGVAGDDSTDGDGGNDCPSGGFLSFSGLSLTVSNLNALDASSVDLYIEFDDAEETTLWATLTAGKKDPPCIFFRAVPAVSEWGLVGLCAVLLIAATILLRRDRNAAQGRP